MNRFIILFIFSFCSLSLLGQEVPPEKYYPNGQLMYRYTVVNGIYEGVCQMWTKDGRLYSQSMYHNGSLDGQTICWHPNGKIAMESDYDKGFLFRNIYYDTLGNVLLRDFISERLTWKQMWTSSGVKVYEEKYKNAIPVSCSTASSVAKPLVTHTSCYYKGELVSANDGVYTDSTGKIINQNYKGFYKTWFENGNKNSVVRFKHGKKHGHCIEWDIDGKVIKDEIYRNGVLMKKII